MRISDWSSDVCSSDLNRVRASCHCVGLIRCDASALSRSRPFSSSDCICAALGSRLARMLSRLRFSSSAAFAASSTCVLARFALADPPLFFPPAAPPRFDAGPTTPGGLPSARSEEHTYALQSLMRISYDDLFWKKQNTPMSISTNQHTL